MTAPIIRTDHAAIVEAAAAFRSAGGKTRGATDAAASAVAAPAAAPLQGGSTEGPEVAVIAAVMQRVTEELHNASGDLDSAANGVSTWEGVIGDIDDTHAGGVTQLGGGGTF